MRIDNLRRDSREWGGAFRAFDARTIGKILTLVNIRATLTNQELV